jgi:hypothetical protein
MITRLDPRIIEVLKGPDKGRRRYVTEQSLVYHAVYYHPEFFYYAIPPFHWDLYDDFECLTKGELKEAAWIAYRESAKTSIAKIGLEWLIVNRKKRFLNVDAYDKGNAEGVLLDVAVSLQTNRRLINDYGQLFYSEGDKEKSQMKRMGSFITENEVRVEAFSTQQSTRGRLYGNIRPDFYLFDDFETNKTKDSYPITKKVKEHIAEARAGMGVNGAALYLGNLIVEDGSVAQLMDDLAPRDNAVVRDIPVIDRQSKIISWPDKYVMTKEEALLLNLNIEDPLRRKVSIESKKEELLKYFEPEMMNNPARSGDYLFNRDVIESKIALAKAPKKETAGMKIWDDFKPNHRYGSGSDTSEGNGLDSSTHVIIDYTSVPARVVSTFKSNEIAPDELAYEIAREGAMFGYPYEATEINNTGWGTVVILKSTPSGQNSPLYPIDRLYQRREMQKLNNQEMNEVGWRTGSHNKFSIISALVTAIEDGTLETFDIDLLNECKYYARRDLLAMRHEEGMTKHFDLLMATAIAWAMKDYAPLPKAAILANIPAQRPYEPSSIYESAGMPVHKPLIQGQEDRSKLSGNDWPSMLDNLLEQGGNGYEDLPGRNSDPSGGIY